MKPNGPVWRHARARMDLSAADAAKALFISRNYLLNIETNQPAALPSMRLVYRAADLYGLEFSTLVAEDEQAPPPEKPANPPPKPERDRDPSSPPVRPDRSRKGPPRADLAAAS